MKNLPFVTWWSQGGGLCCLLCLHPHCLRATAYLKLKFLCAFVFFPFPKLQKTREARHVSVWS